MSPLEIGVRRSGVVAALLLLGAACSHTAPFVTGSYGAVGPYRVVGDEQQLSFNPVSAVAWTLDGAGIVFIDHLDTGQYRLGATQSHINCFTVVAPGGGSAIRQRCGGNEPVRAPRDTDFRFAAQAVGPGGTLLYAEIVGPKNPSTPPSAPPPWPYPTEFHGDLFLGDSSRLCNADRKIMTLYHDANGHTLVPADSANWLTDAAWAAPDTFFVLAQNLSPADVVIPLGIARGVITPQGVALHILPGTSGARFYSPADGGHLILFADTGLVLWKLSPDGGPVSLSGALPLGPSRSLNAVSCAGARCMVISHETAPNGRATITTATLWSFDIATGSMTPLRTFTSPPLPLPSDVALSPVDDDVLLVQGGRLYLIPGGGAMP
jgi:hypothetical protein